MVQNYFTIVHSSHYRPGGNPLFDAFGSGLMALSALVGPQRYIDRLQNLTI